MSLVVCSARLSYGGPDRLDVTRKTAGREGRPFAPSWGILMPALEDMKKADALLDQTKKHVAVVKESRPDLEAGLLRVGTEAAERLRSAAFAKYEAAYLIEMRQSYKRERAAWNALLARERVVIVCYCPDAVHCHRRLLRETILPALGATDGGELSAADQERRSAS